MSPSLCDETPVPRFPAGNHPGIDYKPLPKDDPAVRRPDTTKAEEILGWKAQISLRQGLERTLPWFKEVLEF